MVSKLQFKHYWYSTTR